MRPLGIETGFINSQGADPAIGLGIEIAALRARPLA